MDNIDQALYRLGEQRARQAELFKRKEQVLLIARMNKIAKRGRHAWAYVAAAAALVAGLGLGIFAERANLLDFLRDEPRYIGIPKTDGDPVPPGPTPAQWQDLSIADMRLENPPSSADITQMQFSYLPDGMTLTWYKESGLLEVADGSWERSILAKPCLMYELSPEAYENLAKGFARPRVKQSDAGETGNIAWILRLNDDVYFYVSFKGLSYEESALFIQGIQQNTEDR